MDIVMFVGACLGVYFGLYAFEVFHVKGDAGAHVDGVLCLEKEDIGSEREEASRHFRERVRDGDEVHHALSSPDHEVVYLLVRAVAEVYPAVVEDDDAFLEGFDGGECPRVEYMPLDTREDVVIPGGQFVERVQVVAVRVLVIPLGVIGCDDQGALSGHGEDVFEQRRFAGAVGAYNHDHFSRPCHGLRGLCVLCTSCMHPAPVDRR